MEFLKRLFKDKQEILNEEKRHEKRIHLANGFPLIASKSGAILEIRDLSVGGMRLENITDIGVGTEVSVDLNLEELTAEISGKVAHVYQGMGIQWHVSDNFQEYLALVSPAIIGGSLREFDVNRVNQTDDKYLKRVFEGELGASLTLWCHKSNNKSFDSFDLKIEGLWVRGENGRLHFLRVGDDGPTEGFHSHTMAGVATHRYDGAKELELLKFFSWVVASMDHIAWVQKILAQFDKKTEETAAS